MQTAIITVTVAILTSGCVGKPDKAKIAAGCYRFADGRPFMRISEQTGIFVDSANLKSFKIGSWKSTGYEAKVTPGFVVHDGTVSAPQGASRMAVANTSLSSGVIRYRRVNDQIILSVPIEAYGWDDVSLGKPC